MAITELQKSLLQALERLPWGAYEEVTTGTKHGALKVKKMSPPHPDFWKLWSDPKLRDEMRKIGYGNEKKGGTFTAVRWVTVMSKEAKERLLEESKAMDSTVPLIKPQGVEYRPFQRAGIKFAIDCLHGQFGRRKINAVLIGDDMGLGKTVQAIGIINQDPNLRDIRVLVVCPASLKLNWRNEMRRWLLDGLGSEVIVVKKEWPGSLSREKIIVVNYDLLHKFEREIREENWDYVIMDEAHYMKNENARRTVYALGGTTQLKGEGIIKIIKPIPTEKTIFLTGTPIPNKVEEMWPIIEKCDPTGLGKNKLHFVKRYCADTQNLHELQERMRTVFMIRRMKGDVLKELPPKQRSVMTMDPDEYGISRLFKEEMSIFREYQEVLKSWQVRNELAKAEGLEEYKLLMKTKKQKLGLKAGQLARIRKATAVAKVPGVVEQVKNIVREGSKVILFAHHIMVLDKLQEACIEAGMTWVRIDGSCSQNARQKAVEDFQEGNVDVFIGGIIPAGVGITLTKADHVVFAELDWVPGQMTQCEDRSHRMGQTGTVFVLHMVMEGSLDEYMANKLIQKQDVIEKALDNAAPIELDDEDAVEEVRESFLEAESASSKGVSPKILLEEALKMPEEMKAASEEAMRILVNITGNKVDKEILETLLKLNFIGPTHLALGRKIAYKYRDKLSSETAKKLEWKTYEKE